MDRLDAMAVLLAVVDTGSFSAASRRLGMPLATVSRKVGELEGYLETRLLHRTTRQLSLTETGQAYVAACRRILEDLGEAERVATGEYAAPRGLLAVTAPIVFGHMHVVPLVTEFLARYPDIDLQLTLADRVVHLLEEQVDVAVRIGKLPDSGFVATEVGIIRRVVCASPAYLAAHGRPDVPDDLRAHQCIVFDRLSPDGAWTFVREGVPAPVRVPARLRVNTAEAAIAAATAGLGLTNALSYQVAGAVRGGALEIVLAGAEPAPWPVSLVHAGQKPLPLKMRAFLDFVTPRLRARLQVGPGDVAVPAAGLP